MLGSIVVNNKITPYKIIDININTFFELDQVFCSCPGTHHSKECQGEPLKPIESPEPETFIAITVETDEGKYRWNGKVQSMSFETIDGDI